MKGKTQEFILCRIESLEECLEVKDEQGCRAESFEIEERGLEERGLHRPDWARYRASTTYRKSKVLQRIEAAVDWDLNMTRSK